MPRLFTLLLILVLLFSCSPAPAYNPTLSSSPPVVISSTPTIIRSGPETMPTGPYTPPSVESVTFPPNSGGGMDRETLMSKHGITDAVLKAYEDAAIQEATASGFQAGNLDKNYVDQNELWNMYFRDTTTGNLLWSYRKSDNAMAYQPLMWIIDANGVPQPNPDYQLRPIAGSKDSRIVYTPGNYLVEIAKPIVLSDGTALYAQWRSVLTDELADIPGAAALLPTETPVPTPEMPQYNINRATTEGEFTPTTDEQKQAIINKTKISWTLDENNTTSFHLSLLAVNPDGTSYMRSTCMYGQNCVVRASIVQDIEIEGKIYKVYQYIWEVVVNKQHRVIVINYNSGTINLEGEQESWEKIASAQTGAHVNMRFETKASPADKFNSPLNLWLANNPPNPQAWTDLTHGIIDENLSDDILNGGELTVLNPQ